MEFNQLTEKVLKCAFAVHTYYNPGLLESAYQACLYYELVQAGLKIEKEKALPLNYKGVKLDCGYRIDLLVEDRLIIEIKAVEKILPNHLAQTLTYLKLSKLRHGLILNFNVERLKHGIKRMVNGY